MKNAIDPGQHLRSAKLFSFAFLHLNWYNRYHVDKQLIVKIVENHQYWWNNNIKMYHFGF